MEVDKVLRGSWMKTQKPCLVSSESRVDSFMLEMSHAFRKAKLAWMSNIGSGKTKQTSTTTYYTITVYKYVYGYVGHVVSATEKSDFRPGFEPYAP